MKVNSKIWYDVSCAHKIKLIQSKQSNTQTRKTQTISSSYNITFYYITTSNMKFIQLLTIASLAILTNAPGVSAAEDLNKRGTSTKGKET